MTGLAYSVLALLVAIGLDWATGEPAWLWRRLRHPVVALGALISMLDRRIFDPSKSRLAQQGQGALALLLLLLVALVPTLLLHAALRALPLGWLVEGALMSTLIAWRSLVQHVRMVADGLEQSLVAGRKAVSQIVGRDPEVLDEAAVGRAAIESLAENFSDGVVAPILFGLLFGLPGIAFYKAVNTADSMIGHRSSRHRHCGTAAARLDDLLNLVPARISGLLIAISATLIRPAAAAKSLKQMLSCAPSHRSPNAGWPEAAMAGALDLRLAGPRVYGGTRVEDAWMGEGRAAAGAADIRRAIRLCSTAYGLLVIAVAALAIRLAA